MALGLAIEAVKSGPETCSQFVDRNDELGCAGFKFISWYPINFGDDQNEKAD